MSKENKTNGIPNAWLDNEVPMKEDPYDCYAPGTKERDQKKLEEFKANRKKS